MTLEELEIKVTADISDVVNKLNQLKSALSDKIQVATQKAVTQAKPSIESIKTTITSSTNVASKQMEILNRQIDLQVQKVKKLKQAYLEEQKYAKAYAKAGTSNWATPDVAGAKSKYEQAQIQLDKMTLRADNMRNKFSQASTEAQNTGEKISKNMENAGEKIKTATNHTNKFLQTFGRMIRVMLVRNVINQAIQGFNDLVQVSKEYNASMSNIQSAVLQARNSIATAFAPVVQALEPIIVKLAEAISWLFTQIAMYANAFQGNNFYYKATKSATNYAKSVDKASASQQKMLAGFDELNVLSNKTSGGSGISGLPSTSEMFERVDIPQDVIDRVNGIKEAIKNLLPLLAGIATIIGTYKLGQLFGLWGKGKDLVDDLTGSFTGKNEALGDQQEEYAKELVALKNLVPSFANSTISALAFGQALKGINENPLQLPSTQPLIDYATAFSKSQKTIQDSAKLTDADTKTSFENVSKNLSILADNVGARANEMTARAVTLKNNVISNAGETGAIVSRNTQDWVSNVLENIKKWGINFSINAYNTFVNFVENGKKALETADQNVANFVIGTSKNVASWVGNVSKNVGNLATNMVKSIGSGLKKMWEDFKGCMTAMGEKISGWWNENKSWVIPTAIVGLTITGIALAPFTGGGSLALSALASGGVLTEPTPVLAGEYPTAKSNPEIVTPQSLMYETNLRANVPVINAIEELGETMASAFRGINVYADFGYNKLRVGLDNEYARAGGKLYGV